MKVEKIIIKFFALFCCLAVVYSCDYFRKLAGRPTSTDLEVMRSEMLQYEYRKSQKNADTDKTQAVQPVTEPAPAPSPHDEPEQAPAAAQIPTPEAEPEQVPAAVQSPAPKAEPVQVPAASQKYKYYVVIGSFSIKANAEKQAAKAEKAGYSARLITLPSGMVAVAVGGTDSESAINETLTSVSKESFCPSGAYILKNK